MRRGIMAFEDLNSPTKEGVDVTVAEISADSADIVADGAQIDEAQDIHDSVGEVGDQMEKTIESGDGMDEGEARMAEIAVEHFRSRLQYAKKIMPAMEGFSGKRAQLQSTRLALENVRELQKRLKGKIRIAQENLWARIKNAFSRMFSSNEIILSELSDVAKEYDQLSEHITAPIVAPGWGGQFRIIGKTQIVGSDVVKLLNEHLKLVTTGAFMNMIGAACTSMDQCVLAMAKSGGSIDDKLKRYFNETESAFNKVRVQIAEIVIEGQKSQSSIDKDMVFTPITKAEKTKIMDVCVKLLSDSSLETEIDKFSSSCDAFWGVASPPEFSLNTTNFVLPESVTDLLETATDIAQVLQDLLGKTTRLCHSTLGYMRASAK